MINKIEDLPLWKMWMYALGQFGWCLGGFGAGPLLVYFYMAPEKGAPLFPPYIFQGAVLGAFTIIGIINASTRIFDAVTDPWIANLSDRNKSKFGKRRLFLAIGALPTAVFPVLCYFPPIDGISNINVIWLTVFIVLFYLAITIYCTPYNALISELGHTPKQRLTISTLISVTWALGFVTGQMSFLFLDILKGQGYSSVRAIQIIVLVFAVISFILMMLPVIFIDEKRYCESHVSNEDVIKSLKSTVKNKNFRLFVAVDLIYFFGQNCIGLGLPYFVTILLLLEEKWVSFLGMGSFFLTFLFYIPTNIIARKTGKKKLMIVAFFTQAIVFGYAATLGFFPQIPAVAQIVIIIIFLAPAGAVLGILPNAVVGDIADAHGIDTGDYKAGMFFGARTFMMKFGVAFANLIFPSFLLLGKSVENPLGIRVSALFAFSMLLLGGFIFMRYDEKKIMKSLASHEKIDIKV